MSLPVDLPRIVLDTILGRLARLFLGAADNEAAARDAALSILTAYNAETEEELSLAAEIVCFRMQTLEALSDAADPGLPLTKVLRLRSGAVSISRECHKSQRKLDQLRRDRGIGAQSVDAEAPALPPEPVSPLAAASVAVAPQQAPDIPKANGKLTWSQAYQKRQLAKRIADNSKRHQAEHRRHAVEANGVAAAI